MILSREEYYSQAATARKTIEKIELQLSEARQALADDPENTSLRRELRNLTLDMTITINELEHAESALEQLQRFELISEADSHII